MPEHLANDTVYARMSASAVQSWVDGRNYPFHHNYLMVEGGRMHYIDEGHGEAFVFIHGVPAWSYIWRNLIRSLGTTNRCVAPDLIGFGLSEKPLTFPQTPYAHCRNLTQLIDNLGIEKVNLVLHGMGGPIGLSWAEGHVDRVNRIVLFNSWMYDVTNDPAVEKAGKALSGGFGHFLFVNMNSAPKMLAGMAADKSKLSEDFCRALACPLEQKEARECAWKATRQVIEGAPFFGEVWHERDKLSEIPMLLIWGLQDPVFGEKHLNKIWHEFPLADVERLEGAGHLPMEEKPAEVHRALTDWLTGVEKKPFRLM